MDKLDEAVVQHLEWRILDPRRLEALLNELLERRNQWAESRRQHVAELRRRASEAEAKLNRLYQLIEAGADASEPVLVGRIMELKALRDQAHADANRAAALMEKADAAVTPETLRAFALAARAKLRNEDGTYRRDHLRTLAQRIDVANGCEVKITGSKTELLRTLIAVAGVGSAEFHVRGLYRIGAPGRMKLRTPMLLKLGFDSAREVCKRGADCFFLDSATPEMILDRADDARKAPALRVEQRP